MKKSILILMTTFNGEKYLREQLGSIMEQIGVEVHLLVRDDGSQDATLDILNEFNSHYQNITILKAPVGGRHGAMPNYYELIRIAKEKFSKKYDYFAFSDQDDIWKKDKLVKSIKFLSNPNRPELVYADYGVIDGDENVILESADSSIGLRVNSPIEILLSHSFAWGHSIVFNKMLLKEISVNKTIMESGFPHDAYFAKFASLCNGIHYCGDQLVEYRRYSTNVSGMWYKLSLRGVYKRINLIKEAKVYANVVNSTLLTISENKRSEFIDENIINSYFEIINSSGVKTWRLFLKENVRRKQKSRDVNMKTAYILGFYKKWIGKKKKMVNL